MNGVMGMKEWNECPYCKKIFDVHEIGLYYCEVDWPVHSMCPSCHKIFVGDCIHPGKFSTSEVEDEFDILSTFCAYNKRVDEGTVTEKEIKDFRETVDWYE